MLLPKVQCKEVSSYREDKQCLGDEVYELDPCTYSHPVGLEMLAQSLWKNSQELGPQFHWFSGAGPYVHTLISAAPYVGLIRLSAKKH